MKKIYFLSLILLALSGCTKDPLQPGAIRVAPDSLSAEERRRETLRTELEAALPWMAALDPAAMTARSEAITAADGLHYISRLVVSAEAEPTLIALAATVRAALDKAAPALFPDLRARWAALLREEIWLRAMDYHLAGTEIVFSHGCFSGVGCIVDLHCLIEQELYALHFTRACYKPRVQADPATCMSLNPLPDNLN